MDGIITVDHVCGQVSALETMDANAGWEYDNGKLDDASYAAVRVQIARGWQNVLLAPRTGSGTDVAVNEAVKAAQTHASELLAANPEGYVPTFSDLSNLAAGVGEACTSVGSQIAVKMAPGSGG
ncbi:hypothetical protein [Orlajensenia leifsoniae]|uniref:Uncharacterized protein n=1 Tax=Orlajensenia leifsoniae TaxID=2561933 RepID=A0A4Y9R928_9MICO|nr:hypothetical protein [Leifsonia flava]TFV99896.1 hypothetical protein E4M00_01450 [Leifsonia flava]